MVESDISSPEVSGNTDPPEAYVYVISAESGDVKVGVAKDTWNRLKGLQTAHSRKLSIFYKIGCHSRAEAYAIENRAHKLLEARALQGEWFSASAEEARAAVERAIRDMCEEKLQKEEADKEGNERPGEGVLTYLGPEITPAEPWMRDPMALIRFLVGQEGEPEKQHLFDFGDCIIFVGHRKEQEAGEHQFFMNDVSRWHIQEEDGSPYDATRPSRSPLGNPPSALFATVYEPLKESAA